MAYADIEELLERLPGLQSSDAEVTRLTRYLDSASAAVDSMCQTVAPFTVASAVSARVFTPSSWSECAIDPIGTTSGLIVKVGWPTYTTTVDTTTLITLPENAIARSKPITRLKVGYGQAALFNPCYPSVQVTAAWGWPATPTQVKEATLLLAQRWFRRENSPEGVAGFGDMGVVRVSTIDPDIRQMLSPFTPVLVR